MPALSIHRERSNTRHRLLCLTALHTLLTLEQIALFSSASEVAWCMRLIDEKFRQMPLRFLAQSLLAFASVAFIAIYLGALTNGAMVASLGATAFIVFAMPEHETAQPRKVLGGHALCIVVGLLCSLPLRLDIVPRNELSVGLLAAGAVGLALFGMTLTDTEHPPAAGSALAFAVLGRGTGHVLFIGAAVACLALMHRLLRKWLRDLT